MLLRLIAVALATSFALGCSSNTGGGGNSIAPQTAALQEVADLLRAASADGRAPTKQADLTRFASAYPQGYQAVKSGEVVVIWGAKMAGEGEAGSAPKNIIAYEKKAETEGGWVLLQNGTVKEMTADEFKTAPKAKK